MLDNNACRFPIQILSLYGVFIPPILREMKIDDLDQLPCICEGQGAEYGTHSKSPTKSPISDPPLRIVVIYDDGIKQFI